MLWYCDDSHLACVTQVVTRFSRARRLIIVHVAPFTLIQPFLRKPVSTRETVSREVPMNWAISSCVRVTRNAVSLGFFTRQFQGMLRPAQNELGKFFRN